MSAGGVIGSVSRTATVVVVELGTHSIGVVVVVVVDEVVVDVVDVDGATVVVVAGAVVVVAGGAVVVAGAVVGAAASAAGSLELLQADTSMASAANEAAVRIARRLARCRSVPPINSIMSGIRRLWGSIP